MISTQSTGDRRLTPSQREALGKFVPNPFPPAQTSAPLRQSSSEPLPIRPSWLGGVWLMKALLGWGLTTGLGAGVMLQP